MDESVELFLAEQNRMAKRGGPSASQLVGTLTVVAVCCVWLYLAIAGETRLPIGIADGSYFNSCCGTLNLKNGQLTIPNASTSYVIERDKGGPYVLPKAYVGASDTGFVIRPNGYALKLSLDNPSRPHRINLLDDRPGGASYSFERMNGS